MNEQVMTHEVALLGSLRLHQHTDLPLKNETVMTHEIALHCNLGLHQHTDVICHNCFIM